jgi:hypothetical protein
LDSSGVSKLVQTLDFMGYDSIIYGNGETSTRYDVASTGAITETTGEFCTLLQGAINPSLETSGLSRAVLVSGDFIVNPGDLSDIQYFNGATDVAGPYDICAGVWGTNRSLVSGYPSVTETDWGPSDDLKLHFRNAVVTYNALGADSSVGGTGDDADQADVAVLFQCGSGFMVGGDAPTETTFANAVSDGFGMSGDLKIVFADDSDGAHDGGVSVDMTAADLIENATSAIGMFVTGCNRTSFDNLNMRIVLKSGDHDDFGLIHQDSWGYEYHGWRISSGGGTAMRLYGSASGSIRDPYISGTDFGVEFGDAANGGKVLFFTACVSANCDAVDRGVSNVKIIGGQLEGAVYSDFLSHDHGPRNEIIGTWFEAASAKAGTSFLVGAGTCSGAGTTPLPVGYICAEDSQCAAASGQCTPLAGAEFQSLVVSGGNMPGDGGDASWDGLALGESAADPDGHLTFRDVDFSWNEANTGGRDAIMGVNSAATLQIHFSNPVFDAGLFFPEYEFMSHERETYRVIGIQDLAVSSGECMRLRDGSGSGSLVSCTSVTSVQGLPGGNMHDSQLTRYKWIQNGTPTADTSECLFEFQGTAGFSSANSLVGTIFTMDDPANATIIQGAPAAALALDASGVFGRFWRISVSDNDGASSCTDVDGTFETTLFPLPRTNR